MFSAELIFETHNNAVSINILLLLSELLSYIYSYIHY